MKSLFSTTSFLAKFFTSFLLGFGFFVVWLIFVMPLFGLESMLALFIIILVAFIIEALVKMKR